MESEEPTSEIRGTANVKMEEEGIDVVDGEDTSVSRDFVPDTLAAAVDVDVSPEGNPVVAIPTQTLHEIQGESNGEANAGEEEKEVEEETPLTTTVETPTETTTDIEDVVTVIDTEAESNAISMVSTALLTDLEHRYMTMSNECSALKQELKTSREQLQKTQMKLQQTVEEQSNINDSNSNNMVLQLQNQIKMQEENYNMLQEQKVQLQANCDTLHDEIRGLTAANNELSKKMKEMEIQASLTMSDVVPLHHEKVRLQKEVDNLNSHITWLEQEMLAKSKEYQHLRQESYDHTIQLQMQYDQTSNELIASQAKLSVQQKLEIQLQQQLQQITNDNLQLKLQLQQLEETSTHELQQEQLVIEKQKEHIDLWQRRYNDIVRENETLQRTAQEAMTQSNTEIENMKQQLENKYVAIIQEQAASYEDKINEMKQKYEEDASPPQLMRLTAGHTTTPTATSVRHEDDMEEDGEGPLNMTDLYTKWEECKSALRQETHRRKQWQLQFQKVQQEILQKAPEMMRQRQEYELAMQQIQDYQARLTNAIQERDDAVFSKNEMLQELQTNEKKLHNRTMEVQDLAKQVQALLVSRSTGGNNTGNDIPTSVVEMQNQNQRLLVEHRRLMEQVEELQHQLQQGSMSKHDLETKNKEIRALQQQQKEQEVLVEKIVQQRDLYRALLCKHDSAILNSDSTEEMSAIKMVQQQSERVKLFEKESQDLHGKIKSLESDFDRATRENEHLNEKIVKYDAVQSELTSKINELQKDLLSSHSTIARIEADAKYHTERAQRLEQSIDRTREEINALIQNKSELQKINNELENIITSSNHEKTKLEGEKRQLEAKLRLLDAQLDTTKSNMVRLENENHTLRSDLASQGALIDSIRRIESSLSHKSENEIQTLQNEISRLSTKLVAAETTAKTQTEHYSGRIMELETTVKEYQNNIHNLNNEAIQVKNEMLDTKKELQTLQSLYKAMEDQLLAAKRKLGEDGITGDLHDDVENKLRTQIEALESDLNLAKSEATALQERAENYQKIAKANETELNVIREVTETYKVDTDKEIQELKQLLSSTQQENVSRQEMIRELTNDLAGQREQRRTMEQELQTQIATLQQTIQSNEQDVIAARTMTKALQHDIESLRSEVISAQNNYERELTQHAQARTALRVAHEKVDEATRSRITAEEKVNQLENEFKQMQQNWEDEKANLIESTKLMEKSTQEARDQNKLLHSQLEGLNNLIEKNQLSRINAAATDESSGTDSSASAEAQKMTSELREVIRFLRSENELLGVQLETAKRATEREKAALVVARRSLEEARTELQHYLTKDQNQSLFDVTTDTAAMTEKARLNEEQLVLLRDSNNLLRSEIEQLKSTLHSTQGELESVKNASKPIETVQREMNTKITSLEAEKNSLERELDSWKRRMTSLVSNFNQIDPEEHRQLQKKLDVLKQENESHNSWRKATEDENTRIRTIAQNVNKQRKELQQRVEAQKNEIEQLNKEKTALTAAASSRTGSQAQHQKELEDLKQRISKMENDAKSAKMELDGANSRNDRFREKLREFQNIIRDLRSKEKSLIQQLNSLPKDAAATESGDITVNTETEVTKAQNHGESPAPPAAKVDVAPEDSVPQPSKTATNLEPKVSAPVVDEIMIPSGPPEGFKFGPSKSVGSKKIVELLSVEEKPVTTLRPDAASFVPTVVAAVPATSISAIALETQSTSSKRSIESISKPITSVEITRKQEPTEEKRVAEKSTVVQESAPVAVSSENKEQAFKEKLLERKRQLAEALKEKAMKKKQQQLQQEEADKMKDDEDEQKQPTKRVKTDDTSRTSDFDAQESKFKAETVTEEISAVTELASVPNEPTGPSQALEKNASDKDTMQEVTIVVDEDDTPPMEAEVVFADRENTDVVLDDDNEVSDEIEVEAVDVVEEMDESTEAKGTTSTTPFGSSFVPSTSLSFNSPFGSAIGSTTSPFGSSSAPIFGQSSNILTSPFGSKPIESTTATAPTFGTFGSSSQATTSSIPFGSAAFLDIKPPTSSTFGEAPKFSFGNSGSNITLSAPTIPPPSSAVVNTQPFGVFPSTPFGSNTSSFSGGGISFSSSNTMVQLPAAQHQQQQSIFGASDEVTMDAIDDSTAAMDAQEE